MTDRNEDIEFGGSTELINSFASMKGARTPPGLSKVTRKPWYRTLFSRERSGSVFTEFCHNSDARFENEAREKRTAYCWLISHLEDAEKRNGRKALLMKYAVELVVVSGISAALTRDEVKQPPLLRWRLVSLMALVSGLPAIRLLTSAVCWLIKRTWRIHRYAAYLINGLKWSVDLTLFICLLLLGWRFWVLPRVEKVDAPPYLMWIVPDGQVTLFLAALLLACLLCFFKNFIYLMMEADVLYLRLFERIRYTIPFLCGLLNIRRHNFYLTLPPWLGGELCMYILMMEREKVPIWILRKLSEEYLFHLKSSPLPFDTHVIKDNWKLVQEAIQLFKRIKKNNGIELKGDLHNLSEHGITPRDLDALMLPKEQIDFIFNRWARRKGNGYKLGQSISLDEFLILSVKGYKMCWYFKQNLEGTMKMFVKLNRLLNAFVFVIVLLSWLLLSKIVSTGQIALLFSPFLAASFIFGDSCKKMFTKKKKSCKKMFDGLIFVFNMHPFNVGDNVIINNVQMRVTDLNILTSIFLKYDTGEEVVIPNSTLVTSNIINTGEEVIIPYLSDNIEFLIDAQTPVEYIQDLEAKILMFMNNTTGHYDPNVVIENIGMEHVKMMAVFSYANPTISAERKARHKSRIFRRIIKLLKEMETNMKGYPPSSKVYIVEISLERKARMEDIEDLEAEIMSGLEVRYRHHSKVVLVKLVNSTIKMHLYVRDSLSTKEEVDIHGDEESDIRPLDPNFSDNLKDIGNRLTAMRGLVLDVKIYQPDKDEYPEVNVRRKVGWDVLKPRMIIESITRVERHTMFAGLLMENQQSLE